MKKALRLFVPKAEERLPGVVMLAYFIALNALTIMKYGHKYAHMVNDYFHWFVDSFHVSGFDPLSYVVLSCWGADYNVFRHPLLAFFMYLPNQINHGLMWLTGKNCVQYVMAFILVLFAYYGFIFLYRICRELIGLARRDATMLSMAFYTFAYVMVPIMVPDHFSLSMTMLIFTLYVCGKLQQQGRKLGIGQTLLLFVITAGTSLNNGIKTFLAALFTNKKAFFRPRYILLAVLLPSAVMWKGAREEWFYLVRPGWLAHKEAKKANENKRKQAFIAHFTDTLRTGDKAVAQAKATQAYQQMKAQRRKNAFSHMRHGKPLGKGEFTQWTDITTSRTETLVENLFGESLLLHDTHTLEDVLRTRPIIVAYKAWQNYFVEAVIVLLFALGIWCGRRSRFLWMALSFFGFDMLLHMGLGFGINEVYIMAPHWIYVIPISLAFLFSHLRGRTLLVGRAVVLLLAAYMLLWNGTLLVHYMLG